jgi:putative ABC transport system permease protein
VINKYTRTPLNFEVRNIRWLQRTDVSALSNENDHGNVAMKEKNNNNRVGSRRLITSSIRRRLFRNVATMACFAFIAGTILTAGFLVAGAQMSVQAGMDRLGADMIVIPYDPYAHSSGVFLTGQTSTSYFNESVIAGVKSTPGVLRASPQVYIGTLNDVSWSRYPVQIMGFDPSTDFSVMPLLDSSLKYDLSDNQVIVGHYIQGDIGSIVNVHGQELTIMGRLETTGFSPDNSIYLNMAGAYALASDTSNNLTNGTVTPGQISAILVKADKTIGIDPIIYYISSLNPGTLVYPMNALGRQVSDQLSTTTQSLYLTALSVIVVSMPLVALIATMGANERRREIGLMRAMGATKSHVFSLFFIEAVVLAIIGGTIGVAVSSGGLAAFQEPISNSLNISFLWPSMMTVLSEMSLALALAVGLAGLAAIWPALRASRMEPYDAIRKGQN